MGTQWELTPYLPVTSYQSCPSLLISSEICRYWDTDAAPIIQTLARGACMHILKPGLDPGIIVSPSSPCSFAVHAFKAA